MQFDDSTQPMIWRNRSDATYLKYDELLKSMKAEAEREGYEPMDFNFAGNPNIYFRGKYRIEKDGSMTFLSDGFVMFVRPKQS